MFEVFNQDINKATEFLKDDLAQAIVTSPPYWGQRNYGVDGELGHEKTYTDYINNLCVIFTHLKSKLKDDGCLWVNLGDCYAGSGGQGTKGKRSIQSGDNLSTPPSANLRYKMGGCKLMLPARFAIAMIDDGWILRNEIIWEKTNPLPESVKNRCTKSHETIFLFTKSMKYYYDADAIKTKSKKPIDNRSENRKRKPNKLENGMRSSGVYEYANKRDVWVGPTARFKGAHTAVMPDHIAETCIKASTKEGDLVLDPFMGVGTTGINALKLGRKFTGIDINNEYCQISVKRLQEEYLKQQQLILDEAPIMK